VVAIRGRYHIGRRGRALLFFSGLDLVYAVSLINPDRTSATSLQLVWLATLVPLWAWAGLWAAAGLICGWYAFQRSDRWGFTAAIVIKVLWGGASIGGWLVGGVDRGYVSGAIWLTFAAFVWTISGWPEPGNGRGPTWTREPS
jgi:hypothetical protein